MKSKKRRKEEKKKKKMFTCFAICPVRDKLATRSLGDVLLDQNGSWEGGIKIRSRSKKKKKNVRFDSNIK